jgi:hypothetical protein
MKRKYETVAVVAGLILVLSACEKEIIINAGSEGKVTLTVSMSNSDYVAEEGDVRSFGTQTNEIERVVVPLGDDGDYYLSATLKPDTEQPDELRAYPSNGQRICLAAFNTSNVQVGSTVNYYYSASVNDLIPETTPLIVDVDNTYYIVAYSYNSTTEYPATSNIDPSKDLLWGKSNPKYITFSDRAVSITMAHLFSRVKVNISSTNTGGTIKSIGTVKIAGGKLAGLTLTTGAVAPGSTVADATIGVTGSGATRESGYRAFYPSPTKVTISAVTVTVGSTDHPFSNLSANFTKTLAAGKSYVLAVDLAQANWAHSNIYWDGSKLTFDKYPANSHPSYQGVYFKWGSLVGISPAGSLNSNYGNIAIYIPPVNGESAWRTGKASDANAWGSTFESIRYISPGSGFDRDKNKNYLYDAVGTASHHSNYYGDICSYLTGGVWRIPNTAEFGAAGNYSNPGTIGSDPNDVTGRGSIVSGGVTYNSTYGAVFFPASGYRSDSGNGMTQSGNDTTVGLYVTYWSGSIYDYLAAYALEAYGGLNANPIRMYPPKWALSVRCIRAS